VICDRLRSLQRAAVEQVRGDSGRAPCVTADIDAEACGQGAPANHPVDVGLHQLVACRLSVPDRLKQRRFLFVPQARRLDAGDDSPAASITSLSAFTVPLLPNTRA
jgi:hypothetical protein